MPRRTRRSFLAAAASALLAGCSATGEEDTETVTPYDVPSVVGRRTPVTTTHGCPPACERVPAPGFGPEPLGYAAIPEGSVGGAPVTQERRYGGEGTTVTASGLVADRETVAVDVAPHPRGMLALVWTRSDMATGPPHLVRVDPTGEVESRRRLADPHWRFPGFLARVGDTTVVAGVARTRRGGRLAIQGYREGRPTARREFPRGWAGGAVTTLAGDLLVLSGPGEDRTTAVRTPLDGPARWRRPGLPPAGGTGPAVDATGERVLAAGTAAGGNWAVGLSAGGTERWRQRLPRGPRSYRVVDVAVGSTGRYLLAAASEGRPHGLLASLDDGGAVEWIRLFDPGQDRTDTFALTPVGVLDVNGPLVAGRAVAPGRTIPWLVSLSPAGAPAWAGYSHSTVVSGSESAVLRGVERLDLNVVAYGKVERRAVANPEFTDPWLAWV